MTMFPFDQNKRKLYQQYAQADDQGDYSQIDHNEAAGRLQEVAQHAPPALQQPGYVRDQGTGRQSGFDQDQDMGGQGGFDQDQGIGRQGGFDQDQGTGRQGDYE